MLVFSGWGILGVLIPAFALATFEGIASAYDAQWAIPAGFAGILVGSVCVWFVGRKMNGAPPRELIDEYGNRVAYAREHRLMRIKMEYWAFIAPVLLTIGLIASIGSK